MVALECPWCALGGQRHSGKGSQELPRAGYCVKLPSKSMYSTSAFSGFRVFGFSGSDSGQGPCKVHDSGLTGSESGHVVLALVVPLDTPWLPLVCPWGTKAHRHGQPRAAKGRLLSALDRQNTHLLPRLHVLLIHFQVSRISGFRDFGFSGFQLSSSNSGHVPW